MKESYTYSPTDFSESIKNNSVETIGGNPQRINELVAALQDGYKKKQASLLIMKDNELLVEEYFGEWKAADRHPIQSCTKSVISILMGIAIDNGFVNSVDDPIKNYFPDYASLFVDGKESVTIKSLLTMSAGMAWDESSVPYTDSSNHANVVFNSENPVEFVLNLPMERTPGEKFVYSGGFVVLAAEIIQRATEMSLEKFAEKNLFSKIGMGTLEWVRSADGKVAPAGGLLMSPRDMVKLGQLVLNKGVCKGEQIVSSSWIEESTSFHILIEGDFSYAYYWSRYILNVDGVRYPMIRASGYGGQFILMVEELNLLVVTTADNYGDEQQYSDVLEQYIIPALFSEKE